MKVEMWTDGACSMINRNGGYAVVIVYGEHVKSFSHGELHTTNNIMELKAVVLGLLRLKRPVDLTIYSDSKYVVNGINFWRHTWKRNGWISSTGKQVANLEIWQRLDSLLNEKALNLKVKWVKGHAGNPMNEMADQLAQEAKERIKYQTLKKAGL